MSRELSLPRSITAFLVNRGLLTKDAISSHLTVSLVGLNDPFVMKDMDRAVEVILPHVFSRSKIGIFGDYDADGVTASSLLYLFFKELGLKPQCFIPHRERDGYGLNKKGIDDLIYSGCKLIITCDCGISNIDEVGYARDRGIDMVVTDHHEPLSRLPDASAVINPKRHDCPYPFKELAGVGVAFNLIRALRTNLYKRGFFGSTKPPNLKKYLDLVAIGTISDMMPLFEDNRILVRAGLSVLKEGGRAGLDALMERAGLRNGNTYSISSRDIAFRIGPRLNAAGRMDSAWTAFELLICDDREEAKRLAERLEAYNQERQREEKRLIEEVLSLINEMGDRSSYILFGESWQKGILGLVAAKAISEVLRPVILLTREGDELVGSGRCPEGLDLFSALTGCEELLTRFGGHKVAAGLKLRKTDFSLFKERFEEIISKQIQKYGIKTDLSLDCEVDLREMASPDYLRFFELLEPFGPGYESPLFCARNFFLKGTRLIGDRHLKLYISPEHTSTGSCLDLVAWGHGDKVDLSWEELELAFTPSINFWQGRKSLQLVLKDARRKTR